MSKQKLIRNNKMKITSHIYLSSHSITICIYHEQAEIKFQIELSKINSITIIFIRNHHSNESMTIRGLLLDQPSRPPPSKSTDQVLPMMLLLRRNRTTTTNASGTTTTTDDDTTTGKS